MTNKITYNIYLDSQSPSASYGKTEEEQQQLLFSPETTTRVATEGLSKEVSHNQEISKNGIDLLEKRLIICNKANAIENLITGISTITVIVGIILITSILTPLFANNILPVRMFEKIFFPIFGGYILVVLSTGFGLAAIKKKNKLKEIHAYGGFINPNWKNNDISAILEGIRIFRELNKSDSDFKIRKQYITLTNRDKDHTYVEPNFYNVSEDLLMTALYTLNTTPRVLVVNSK